MTAKKIKKKSYYKKSYLFIKRIFDLICSIVGIIFLIPLTIIVKLCYILTGDFSSIFYTQKRIGQHGKIFTLYKYRTMVLNADDIIEKWLEENPDIRKEYLKNRKLKNDPRITKIGRLLRIASLDEFPQFVNVLKSEMSLIGNRPYMLREKKDMGKYYEDIVKTKPGITGLWQVSGRNVTTFKKRLQLEQKYSKTCSIKLDLKILLKTFVTVLKRDGAL